MATDTPSTPSTASTPAVRTSTPPEWLIRIANPIVRGLVQSPLHALIGKKYAVLRVRGHKTGTEYVLPVGWHDLNDEVYVLTEAGWRRNIGEATDVEVTHAGKRVPKKAERVANPEAVARAYLRAVEMYGARRAKRLVGVEVDVERAGFEEMAEACASGTLSAIRLHDPE